MNSNVRRVLTAAALQSAYHDGERNFRQMQLTGVIARLDLTPVDFTDAHLQNVTFEDVTLQQINFEGVVFETVTFRRVTLMAGNFANACCQALQFESSAIRAANFDELTFKRNDLQWQHVTLDETSFVTTRTYALTKSPKP
ncbi:MAG: pentapeptide repeat-containing protein [Cyanobacteria bacterium P01_H01_bin.162]